VVSASKVVEDGLEASSRSTGDPRWGWLAAGILIGIGLSVIGLRAGSGDEPTATTIDSTATTDLAEDTPGAPEGIADVVAGFPDGLTTTIRAEGRSLELLVWPRSGDLYERAIPVGASTPPGPVGFDASGRRMATLLPLPGKPFGVLYAGVPENASIIDLDVTGYAWHDSNGAELAYTTFEDDELLLWVTGPKLSEPALITRAVGIEGQVAAWGEWGFAIQDEARESIVLMTPSGEIKDTHPGRVLDSHATGWLAVEGEGVRLLSAGGGVRGLERQGLDGDFLVGGFNDDGSSLAVLNADQILVVPIESEFDLLESGGPPGVAEIAWSSDGNFVMYPGRRGIWVVNVHNGRVEQVLDAHTFTGLGTLPLSSS